MKSKIILSSFLLASCSASPRSLFTEDLGSPAPADLVGFPSGSADLGVASVTITGIAPARASTVGRDAITITGSGFDSTTQFAFGGIVAEIISVSDATAKVYAPGNPGNWGVPIPVTARRARDGAIATNSNAASSPSAFRYYAANLVFTELVGRLNSQFFSNPRVPLVGDFNNDGLPDLIVTSISNGTHSMYLNSVSGNFVNTRNDNTNPSNLTVQKGMVTDGSSRLFAPSVVAL